MFKNRSFLKGLGSGFIAGALLLQIMIMVREVDNRVPQTEQGTRPEVTAEVIKQRAAEFNLKVYDKNEKVYDQKQLDDTVAKAVAAAKAEGAGAPAGTQGPKQVTVYILEGMPATNVVDLLYKSGIIVDRQALETTIIEGQYTSKLRAGLYTFNLNEKIEDVIAKLTAPPRH
ncbi:hypothetical protein [Gorillibacterium sp. sgz5001074]|uniref:hypothetical protein n=1 Tax=Gorillibacterium sp. sgz5001074 TaxID=3446695 RepID=UPI003F672CC3